MTTLLRGDGWDKDGRSMELTKWVRLERRGDVLFVNFLVGTNTTKKREKKMRRNENPLEKATRS